MKKILVVLVLFFIVLAGCAASGSRIDQSKVEQIKIGTTTKDQMMAMFGRPLSQTYSSDGNLTFIWMHTKVGPFGMGMKMQNLSVLFDDQNTVLKFNMIDSGTQ